MESPLRSPLSWDGAALRSESRCEIRATSRLFPPFNGVIPVWAKNTEVEDHILEPLSFLKGEKMFLISPRIGTCDVETDRGMWRTVRLGPYTGVGGYDCEQLIKTPMSSDHMFSDARSGTAWQG